MTVGMSISRHNDSVLLVLRVQDEAARLAGLLRHAQRLGRIGGFEENTLTGEITWSSQLYMLYGLAQGSAPIPLQQLGTYAHPDDADALGGSCAPCCTTAGPPRRCSGCARPTASCGTPG